MSNKPKIEATTRDWSKHTNEDLGILLGEIYQEIDKRDDIGSNENRIRLPKSTIRRLRDHISRFPYLEAADARNIACALQLCDANQWMTRRFRLSLTAGSMWEWQITLPIAAIIETLLKHYIKLNGWQPEKDGFESYIDECGHRKLFDAETCDKLNSLREYRNKVHLYLNGHISLSDGHHAIYENAVELLNSIEKIILKHWKWNNFLKKVASKEFSDTIDLIAKDEDLLSNILCKFRTHSQSTIKWIDSYSGEAFISGYHHIDNLEIIDIVSLPSADNTINLKFSAYIDVDILYVVEYGNLEYLKRYHPRNFTSECEINHIGGMVEERIKLKVYGGIESNVRENSQDRLEIDTKNCRVSDISIDLASNSEAESPRANLKKMQALVDISISTAGDGASLFDENIVILTDSRSEAKFYSLVFEIIDMHRPSENKKIKFIYPSKDLDVPQLSEIIHNGGMRLACIVSREKLKQKTYLKRLLDGFGVILGDILYANSLYESLYGPQEKSKEPKAKLTKDEKEALDRKWDELILMLRRVGIFILPQDKNGSWMPSFFEGEKECHKFKSHIEKMSHLKDYEKFTAVANQESWRFMRSICEEIRILEQSNLKNRRSVRSI